MSALEHRHQISSRLPPRVSERAPHLGSLIVFFGILLPFSFLPPASPTFFLFLFLFFVVVCFVIEDYVMKGDTLPKNPLAHPSPLPLNMRRRARRAPGRAWTRARGAG